MKKIKFPIWLKLSFIILSLILIVASYIGKSSYQYFEKTLIQREEFSNITETRYRSNQLEQQIQSLTDKSISIGREVMEKPEYVLKNNDLLNVEIWVKKEDGSFEQFKKTFDNSFIEKNKLPLDYFSSINSKWIPSFEISNVSFLNQAIGQLVVPFVKKEEVYTHYLIVNFSLSYLQKTFTLDGRSGFVLNNKFQYLASSNDQDLFKVKNEDINIRELVKQKINEQQFSFSKDGKHYLASLISSPNFGIKTFISTDREVVLEPAINVRNKIIYMTSVLFSIAIFIVYFFSASLTNSITVLNKLVQKVASGDFSVKSQKLVKTFLRDETTELAENFDKMTTGLSEREKFKNILHKFHGKSVGEDLMNKENLSVGGEKKEVCVFFSDIRGFTSFSESTSPEKVVAMLNEYFETMVSIINKRGGVVDKFIGDAIMAVWGVPNGSPQDAYNATMACLEMRQALNDLNQKRIKRGENPIMIGMGLHTGQAISGIIGSSEKMEYTVIGDTVNVTSRLESSTKSMGTDLLLSEQMYLKIKESFVISEAGKVSVKGKKEELTLYKVNGFIENGSSKLVQTPYSSYEAEEDSKVHKVS